MMVPLVSVLHCRRGAEYIVEKDCCLLLSLALRATSVRSTGWSLCSSEICSAESSSTASAISEEVFKDLLDLVGGFGFCSVFGFLVGPMAEKKEVQIRRVTRDGQIN